MKTEQEKEQHDRVKRAETCITGAEALLECLIEEGVDTIFGYPGGAIMPVYDKLMDYEDKLHAYSYTS